MTWRTAFSNLAAISVTGVATSYDLDELPNVLPAADLPALVIDFPAQSGWRKDAQGLAALTYDESVWLAGLQVEHVLYWAPAWSDVGLLAALPDLIDVVDAYLAAVAADGTLSDALHEPLVIERVQVGVVEFAGVQYYGARFRHRWFRQIDVT